MQKEEEKSEEDECTMIMRRVVVRSSGLGSSKRAWVVPPSKFENPQKTPRPTTAEHLGLVVSAAAVAAATACATTFGGATAPGAKSEAAIPQDVLPTPS